MKSISLIFGVISLVRPCTATFSTFGTRGGNKDDDEGNIIIVNLDGSEVTVSDNRNEIVEDFFRGSKGSLELKDAVADIANNMTFQLIETRRSLHRHPELMYQEKYTSSIVQSLLTELQINFTTGWSINTHTDFIPGPGGYGVVADLGTGKAPCVVLRADMDALPILERTEGVDEFISQNPGKMHACGHDGHTTMLLGAAQVLKSMESSLNGTVRLMFQPAEEGGAGAKRMREEGVLRKEPVASHAFGIHVWPTLPSGSIGSRAGPLLAACDRFEILIAGVGGHAAMPHLTRDPIVAASSLIMNLQTLVSRSLSPLESGVVSITKFESGEAFNIIPASALLRGTIRSLTTDALLELRGKVERMVNTTMDMFGCNSTIEWSRDYYPPTVNDPELYQTFSKEVADLVSDEGHVREIDPTMGAEDFSFVAESIPSTFFLLGQGSGTDPPTNYGLHHPHFALDESILPKGVELHVNLALNALKKLHKGDQDATTSTT